LRTSGFPAMLEGFYGGSIDHVGHCLRRSFSNLETLNGREGFLSRSKIPRSCFADCVCFETKPVRRWIVLYLSPVSKVNIRISQRVWS